MANIFVFEDEASTRRLIVGVLQKEGHTVTEFDNGAEGLLYAMAELPDLVISDIEMPKLNGFEVLSQLRREPACMDIPVILLTNLSSSADIQKGLSRGANDYITKPFEPARLIESVNARLEEREANRNGTLSALMDDFSHIKLKPLADSTQPAPLMPALRPVPQPSLAVEKPAFAASSGFSLPVGASSPVAKGDGWAIAMEVHNQDQMMASMPVTEWRVLLRHLFLPIARDPALRVGDYLELEGGRVILYFRDRVLAGVSGTQRAVEALEAFVRAAAMCRNWANEHFQGLNIPPIRIVVTMHKGPIYLTSVPLDVGGQRETVVGATAQLIERVRQGQPPVFWRVIATDAVIKASPEIFRLGASMEVSMGTTEVLVHALQGLQPNYVSIEDLQPHDWI